MFYQPIQISSNKTRQTAGDECKAIVITSIFAKTITFVPRNTTVELVCMK